jgi:hypothetical protein
MPSARGHRATVGVRVVSPSSSKPAVPARREHVSSSRLLRTAAACPARRLAAVTHGRAEGVGIHARTQRGAIRVNTRPVVRKPLDGDMPPEEGDVEGDAPPRALPDLVADLSSTNVVLACEGASPCCARAIPCRRRRPTRHLRGRDSGHRVYGVTMHICNRYGRNVARCAPSRAAPRRLPAKP